MEMRFELDCPQCGNPLRIPVQYLGQRGRCVACKNLIDTDVNMRLPGARTLLHQAARSGDAVLVRFLLARGADPNARDDAGQTPLDVAQASQHAEIHALLFGYSLESNPAPKAAPSNHQGSEQQKPRAQGPRMTRKLRSVAKTTRVVLKWTAVSLVTIAFLSYCVTWIYIYNLSQTKHGSVDLRHGNIRVPSERTMGYAKRPRWEDPAHVEAATREDELLKSGATKGVSPEHQFAMGWNLDIANRCLREARPGDGEHFGALACAKLLYNFGDEPEIMYPESRDYLVNVLLPKKGGEEQHYWTPDIWGLPLRDTENIILGYEVSRYLTNQWIKNHGNDDPFYDNAVNGQEAFLLEYLQGIEREGFHEFHSIPYQRCTLDALGLIATFAESPSLAASATRILDRVNWNYALGSLSLRRHPPFRRRRSKAGTKILSWDLHTPLWKTWLGVHGDHPAMSREERPDQWVIYTMYEPYRPPDDVVKWIFEKPVDYFVQMGHGSDGSPEIYSGGPGYLITAGGVTTALIRNDVARPTTLMLNDGVMDVDGLLRVMGPVYGPEETRPTDNNLMITIVSLTDKVFEALDASERVRRPIRRIIAEQPDYTRWNNTGVYEKFAVAAGPVIIPEGWEPDLTIDKWLFFERSGQKIAVYSSPNLGLFCLLPEDNLQENARLLAEANVDTTHLQTTFQIPWGDTLEYDVYAEKDKWVIRAINGEVVDRDHGSWPLLQGEVPGYQTSEYEP